ncbi:MAG: hypothetical protein WCZ87_11975, partial [Thiohalobacteraceae bacterium]
MSADITIALDAMGGDHGADTVIPAALNTLEHQADLRLILVGEQTLLEQSLQRAGYSATDGRLQIQ